MQSCIQAGVMVMVLVTLAASNPVVDLADAAALHSAPAETAGAVEIKRMYEAKMKDVQDQMAQMQDQVRENREKLALEKVRSTRSTQKLEAEKMKSQQLQELVRKISPSNPKLGEDWGFGGATSFGSFAIVSPRFEESLVKLGEAEPRYTPESHPDDSHVLLAQAHSLERHQDDSDLLDTTELIETETAPPAGGLFGAAPAPAPATEGCEWYHKDHEDHKDCYFAKNGPTACADATHPYHRWAHIHCKRMCNPQCAPREDCVFEGVEDHPHCSHDHYRGACEPTHENYHWAQINCPRMCNPECNPKVPHLSFGSETFIPGATFQPGHRNCEDRVIVLTEYGETKNYAKKKSQKVAVCAKCSSDRFMLQPAFVVGNKVVGVCEKVTEHWLWKEQQSACNDLSRPCAGQKLSRCEKFLGRFGDFRMPGGDSGRNPNTIKHSHNSYQEAPGHSALAFTCSRLYAHDFSDSSPYIKFKKSGDQEWGNGGGKMIAVGELPAKAVGRINVYRIVQAKITSCYSTNEEKAERQKMKCVDRKEVKSCHTRRLHLPALDMEAVIKEETTGSGKYKNRFQNIKEDNMSKADAKSNQQHKMKKATKQIARWTKLMKEIALERFMDGFKNGVKQPTIHDVIHQPTMKGVFDQLNVEGTGSGMVWEWSECDELAEKVAISLA